jgi:hypothetical protein
LPPPGEVVAAGGGCGRGGSAEAHHPPSCPGDDAGLSREQEQVLLQIKYSIRS